MWVAADSALLLRHLSTQRGLAPGVIIVANVLMTQKGTAQQGSLSFVDKIPLEIILEVVGCLGIYSADDSFARTLSLVCTTFRRVIVNDPTFWKDIIVGLDKACTASGLKWLHLKIERSQPLSIRCRMIGMRETAIPNPKVDALLACCERWEELHLCTHPVTLLSIVSPAEGRLERLRKLSLSVSDMRPGELRMLKIPSCFKDAPVLEHIELAPLPSGDYSLLPLRQIRHCAIEDAWPGTADDTFTPIMSILLHPQSQLRELRICRNSDTPQEWGRSTLYAPHLQVLDLRGARSLGAIGEGFGNYTGLLDILTAPSLQKFCAQWINTLLTQALLRFAERSACGLRDLDLQDTLLDRNVVRLLDISSSTLTNLTVQIEEVASLQSLLPRLNVKDPPFLPKLKSLSLVVQASEYWDHSGGNLYLDGWRYLLESTYAGELDILNSIGLARCERDLSGSSSAKLALLENLEIQWDLSQWLTEGKAQVYASLPFSECGFDLEVLATLRQCSKMFSQGRAFQYKLGEERDKFYERVLELLVEHREVFNNVTNAQYLYRSGLHTTLENLLSSLLPSEVAQEVTTTAPPNLVILEIERRGTRLLKRFFDLLREDVPRLRWRLSEGSISLIYTPEDHLYRKEKDVAQMIYGGRTSHWKEHAFSKAYRFWNKNEEDDDMDDDVSLNALRRRFQPQDAAEFVAE